MKNGQCPKCNSREIYVSLKGGGVGFEPRIAVQNPLGMESTLKWQTLLCAACGYFENYLLDELKIAQIVDNPQKAGWKKIS